MQSAHHPPTWNNSKQFTRVTQLYRSYKLLCVCVCVWVCALIQATYRDGVTQLFLAYIMLVF